MNHIESGAGKKSEKKNIPLARVWLLTMADALRVAMDALSLGVYFDALLGAGVSSIELAAELQESDLRALGFKPFHVRKFAKLSPSSAGRSAELSPSVAGRSVEPKKAVAVKKPPVESKAPRRDEASQAPAQQWHSAPVSDPFAPSPQFSNIAKVSSAPTDPFAPVSSNYATGDSWGAPVSVTNVASGVVCPLCSAPNLQGYRWCHQCGQPPPPPPKPIVASPPMGLFCSSCGEKNFPGFRFCSNCGVKNALLDSTSGNVIAAKVVASPVVAPRVMSASEIAQEAGRRKAVEMEEMESASRRRVEEFEAKKESDRIEEVQRAEEAIRMRRKAESDRYERTMAEEEEREEAEAHERRQRQLAQVAASRKAIKLSLVEIQQAEEEAKKRDLSLVSSVQKVEETTPAAVASSSSWGKTVWGTSIPASIASPSNVTFKVAQKQKKKRSAIEKNNNSNTDNDNNAPFVSSLARGGFGNESDSDSEPERMSMLPVSIGRVTLARDASMAEELHQDVEERGQRKEATRAAIQDRRAMEKLRRDEKKITSRKHQKEEEQKQSDLLLTTLTTCSHSPNVAVDCRLCADDPKSRARRLAARNKRDQIRKKAHFQVDVRARMRAEEEKHAAISILRAERRSVIRTIHHGICEPWRQKGYCSLFENAKANRHNSEYVHPEEYRGLGDRANELTPELVAELVAKRREERETERLERLQAKANKRADRGRPKGRRIKKSSITIPYPAEIGNSNET